ncbi:MAG: methyl-accepting chemotaxis protein [Syntrophobacteraceae bacterium]
MRGLRGLRIEVKLIGAFVLVSAIAAVVGVFGVGNMSAINDLANGLYSKELLGLSYAKEANSNLLYIVRAEKNLVLANKEDAPKYFEQAKASETAYLESMQKAKALFYTQKEKELMANVEKCWEEYIAVHKQIIELAATMDIEKQMRASILSMELAQQKVDALDNAMTELTKIKESNAKAASEETTRIYRSSRNIQIGIIVAGILLSVCLGVLSTLSITRPINRIIAGMTAGAQQVATASGQVSSASQQLAHGASEQAASIEETSASLEEMASMTKQNAGNATQANTLMGETSRVVALASQSMDQLTSSMNEISMASEETSKIIKTIDEIAFQTNLLALNAAVEAARAGEAGAGFAVVADEVRNLAMRAAEAAKNTANLLEGTVKKVKEGSVLVQKTGSEFSQVTASSSKMSELVGEITAASNEQSQGIEQINKAVSEMDKVVQENASNAEESASASEEMTAQAKKMKVYVEELVAVLGGSNGKAVSKQAAVPAKGKKYAGVIASNSTPSRTEKPSNGNGKAKDMSYRIAAGKEMSPRDIIPFGDDEFKEF